MDSTAKPSQRFEYDPIEIGFRIAEWAVKGVIFGWPVVLWFIAKKLTYEVAFALCIIGFVFAVLGFVHTLAPGIASRALLWTFHWLILFLIMGRVDDVTSLYRHRTPFDVRDWSQSMVGWGLNSEFDDTPTPRARMLDDLLSQHLFMGQNRVEVTSLLGPPQFGDWEDEMAMEYGTESHAVGLLTSEARLLRITFDEVNRVNSIDVIIDTTSGW